MSRPRAAGRVVLALVALGVLAGCGSGGVEPSAVADAGDMRADNIIVNAQEWLTKDGVRSALLVSDTAFVFRDSSVVHLKGVRVTMYDENGKSTGHLTSKRGTVNQRTQGMTALGNVVLIMQGRRIETEELHYEPRSSRIWSQVATTMTDNGNTVHGTSFSALLGPGGVLKNVHVENPKGTSPNGAGAVKS